MALSQCHLRQLPRFISRIVVEDNECLHNIISLPTLKLPKLVDKDSSQRLDVDRAIEA